MGAHYSPIDLLKAAASLTRIARESGYADWDGDSSELFIARAAKRLMVESEGISGDEAVKEVVERVLSRSPAQCIPLF